MTDTKGSCSKAVRRRNFFLTRECLSIYLYVMVRHSLKRKAANCLEETTSLPSEFGESVLIQFCDAQNEAVGVEVTVPLKASKADLLELLKANLDEEQIDDSGGFSLVLSTLR